jgi:CheY-like chemotaxis protein
LSHLLHSWPARRTILLVDDDPFLAWSRKSVLEKRFRTIERVQDAAQAFIRVNDADFAAQLGLVIVALTQPGLAGPQFVAELSARLPDVPILAIGRVGDVSHDYPATHVSFLPRHATAEDLLAGACDILSIPQAA